MRALLQRALSLLVAAFLCVSLGGPACVFAAVGAPFSTGDGRAFAAEGDVAPAPHQLASVPDCRGLSIADASARLQTAGFSAALQGPQTSTALVVGQIPAAGEQVTPGSSVTLTLEEQMVSVPDVSEMTVPAAISKLESAGFTVNMQGDATSTSIVVGQRPQAGAKVEPGSVITLTGKESAAPDEPSLKQIGLIPYTTDAHGQWVAEMPRTPLDATNFKLNDGIKDKGGKIRLMVQASWSNGDMIKQSESTWKPLGEAGQQDVQWTSSGADIATVDATGVVTAVGDGDVVITATAPNGLTSTMALSVIGQDGAFVTGARVVDESGDPYGTSYLEISDLKTGSRQFYVRLTYSDGTTACNVPGADDRSDEGDAAIAAACTWTITSSDVGKVNAASGFFVPQHDGRAQVIVTATGGDPNVNHGLVTASVAVSVNTGTYTDGNAPSSKLVVQVEYEAMPGVVGQTATFSIDELKSLESTQVTYTLTRSQGKYVTDTAQGIYLATLLDQMGIGIDKVSNFRLAANDGANPGAISAAFLFGAARYYFPLANFGSDVGAVPVAPMLAYADSWKEGGTCDPSTELNSGTCLRLMFGSRGLADNSTSLSVKYINTMKVVMSGSPPVGWGEKDDPSGGGPAGPGGGPAGPGGGPAGPGGGQLGSGGGGDQEPDGANHFGSVGLISSGGGDSSNPQAADNPGSSAGDASDPSPTDSSNPMKADQDESALRGSSQHPANEGPRWQVYQMMSQDDSDIPPIVLNNPFAPYVVPLSSGVVVLGAASSGLLFVRRWRGTVGGLGRPPSAPA